MDLRRTKLDMAVATEIKAMLWLGQTQEQVASDFGIHQTTVSRIVRGKAWYEARWPDGTVGAMSSERAFELKFPSQPSRLLEATHRLAVPPIDSEASSEDAAKQATEDQTDDQAGPETVSEGAGVADASSDGDGSTRSVAQHTVQVSDVDRWREDRDARAAALDDLAQQAEQQMESELEAITAHASGPARRGSSKRKQAGKPEYELYDWDELRKLVSKNPLVAAAVDDEELRYCVRAAFKLLPRGQWGTPAAAQLVKEIADSVGIKLSKEK